MAALWSGRFKKDMDEMVKEFNASIGFDQRMYNEDIDGSIAHVTMLAKQGIVTDEERDQIIQGLEKIREGIKDGTVDMVEASCKNQICVHEGKISRSGQSIVCLPNRVSIVIEGKGGDEYDTASGK